MPSPSAPWSISRSPTITASLTAPWLTSSWARSSTRSRIGPRAFCSGSTACETSRPSLGGREMDKPTQSARTADLRDYLAAERTLLAWIRTGLALMGFGFVVARFALFLQQVHVVPHAPYAESSGLSLWFGTALIGAGVAVLLFAAWHHWRLVGKMNRGQLVTSHSQTLAVASCLFLALVG